MASLGLLAAGGIGNALSQGVDSYLQVKRLKRDEDNERQRMGLLAADKNMQLDPETGTYGLTDFGQSQRDALLKKQGIDEQRALADINKTNAETGLLKKKTSAAGNEAQTEAEKAVDRKYGERYNAWTDKGANNAANAIKKLEDVASELEGDTGFFQSGGGRVASVMHDSLRSRDAIRRRDQARNAANVGLKELFPGAVSDDERVAAAKEFYNDALDNKENAKILRQKISELKDNYNSQEKKSRHYENKRTLRGYKGDNQRGLLEDKKTTAPADRIPTIEEFYGGK